MYTRRNTESPQWPTIECILKILMNNLIVWQIVRLSLITVCAWNNMGTFSELKLEINLTSSWKATACVESGANVFTSSAMTSSGLPLLTINPLKRLNQNEQSAFLLFCLFFRVRLLSVLLGHSVFSSPPQQPMTSDFEGFSIPDFIQSVKYWKG